MHGARTSAVIGGKLRCLGSRCLMPIVLAAIVLGRAYESGNATRESNAVARL